MECNMPEDGMLEFNPMDCQKYWFSRGTDSENNVIRFRTQNGEFEVIFAPYPQRKVEEFYFLVPELLEREDALIKIVDRSGSENRFKNYVSGGFVERTAKGSFISLITKLTMGMKEPEKPDVMEFGRMEDFWKAQEKHEQKMKCAFFGEPNPCIIKI